MKVLLTLDFPPQHGGIQRYLFSVVKHRYGPGDRVITPAPAGPPPPQLSLPCPVEYVPSPLSLRRGKLALVALARHYRRLVAQVDCPIETECGNLYAAMVPWLFRRPYAVYTYGTELLRLPNRSLRSAVLRKVLSRAHTACALGAYTARLLDNAGFHGPVVVLPPRLDVDETCVRENIARRRARASDGVFRILCAGRLVHHKGQQVLLDALRLLDRTRRWEVWLAGSGPQLRDLLRLRSRYGLDRFVSFLPGLSDSDLAERFSRADVLVLPSLTTSRGTEGFGIVLLEAMSHGVPVVASRCGGIPEVVGDAGILVPQGDARALAEALSRLMSDSQIGVRLGEAGARRLLEAYVWK